VELHVVIEGRRGLVAQLVAQLGGAIRSGKLAAGTQLPPSRLLAVQLSVSRKTVDQTYQRLRLERLLVTRTGSGTFVADGAHRTAAAPRAVALAGDAVLARWRDMPLPMSQPEAAARAAYEYVGGSPDRKLFPHTDWRRCMLHAIRVGVRTGGFYGEPEGLAPLRDAIAQHAAFARGVRCDAANVLVTSGAQQALDLIARVLVEPGSVVAVEEPGYPPARMLFQGQGAQVVGVPVDAEGLMVDAIPPGTRLIYTTPAHQFPLGMPMSVRRREALLERAAALGAIVVEDDYDSEFRYAGRPADCLQRMDQRGLVAFVGTFSKTLTPAMRLGYLIAPAPVLAAVRAAKHLSDWHTAIPTQSALQHLMADGALQRHIRRAHVTYAARRERIVQRMEGDLSPWFEVVPSQAGIHLAVLCRQSFDVEQLQKLARRVDVGLYPLTPFFHAAPARNGLLMGFGAIQTADIDPSLDRVRDVLQQMTR
jgi:GntR family transcriptional regulator/MocR family aminotransferase